MLQWPFVLNWLSNFHTSICGELKRPMSGPIDRIGWALTSNSHREKVSQCYKKSCFFLSLHLCIKSTISQGTLAEEFLRLLFGFYYSHFSQNVEHEIAWLKKIMFFQYRKPPFPKTKSFFLKVYDFVLILTFFVFPRDLG